MEHKMHGYSTESHGLCVMILICIVLVECLGFALCETWITVCVVFETRWAGHMIRVYELHLA